MTCKASFSNGKLQASIWESVSFRSLAHHSVPFRRIDPTYIDGFLKLGHKCDPILENRTLVNFLFNSYNEALSGYLPCVKNLW